MPQRQRIEVFWFFAPGIRFSKKNRSARGWWGGRAQAKAKALLFEKRSKNFHVSL
jgi:hypothetical protein